MELVLKKYFLLIAFMYICLVKGGGISMHTEEVWESTVAWIMVLISLTVYRNSQISSVIR